MKKFLVAIDQGTTSSRAILFSLSGKPIYTSQKEFKQNFPKNGWVEHNPNEIWSTVKKVLFDVIAKSKKLKGEIISIGITNQRETTILWNKKTGKHIYNAIVWQDRRTEDLGQYILKALSDKKGAGIGFTLGICVAFIGLIFDNLIRTWVEKRKKHLGIN